MLVAKLDFLQLLVIKGSLAVLAKRTSQLWRALQKAFADGAPESSASRCAASSWRPIGAARVVLPHYRGPHAPFKFYLLGQLCAHIY